MKIGANDITDLKIGATEINEVRLGSVLVWQRSSYLLDLYTGAAVAYSMRKLKSSYTGACMRVRRSSDNAEQDIGFLGDDLDTDSLLSFVGVGNGFVTTWYDQSGNARDASQGFAGGQPLIVSAGNIFTINSKSSIFLNGTSHRLNITPFNFNSTNYNSFVGKRATAGRRMYGLGGEFYLHALWNDNRYYLQARNIGYQTSNATDTSINQLLLTGLNNGTSQEIYKNSSIVASSFVTFTIPTLINAIGAYLSNTNFLAQCELQEIVFYNSDQSANRTAIETNINNYYNVY
jgi:hypothetical protein